MPSLTRKQLALLIPIIIIWGVNWPIMKAAMSTIPPMSFRMITFWIGLLILGSLLIVLRVPFRIPVRQWPELVLLSATNMFVWYGLIIVALNQLPSGRAAILGYTMPIFTALIGSLVFGERLTPRNWLGVGAASGGVGLLLWHELSAISGKPWYMAVALVAAATWALGTLLLRRTSIKAPTLTVSFWMTALTAVVMSVCAFLFERPNWSILGEATSFAVLYNAVLIIALSQAGWFVLARELPPIASTLSVMLIPVVGVFSGTIWLGEILHWQDWAAMILMSFAIVSVLWPNRALRHAPKSVPVGGNV